MRKTDAALALFGLFCLIAMCMFIGIRLDRYMTDKGMDRLLVDFFVILQSILWAIIFIIFELVRRRHTVKKPLDEILEATKEMAKGNFDISLKIHHAYESFDHFDSIKNDLNIMANELSKLEVFKTDFISNMSHEMKTPLAVIQNYATLLKNDKLSKEDKDLYLNNLQQSCKKLSLLISNILKLNKLENQRLIPDIKEFNLSESLINQVLMYEELIEKKNITLDCDIEEDLIITSEESYLEIVWNNLMSNAIKFTKDTIKVTLKKENNKYIINFIDNGIGMDKNTGMHIFDKFYQGDTSHSKEGNGLGLPLVKEVINILGGEISVSSELGKGSNFEIVIKESSL